MQASYRHKTHKKHQATGNLSNADNEYDLQNSFRKIKQHSGKQNQVNNKNYHLTQTQEDDQSYPKLIANTDSSSPHTESGGISWNEYMRLDNKLDSINNQNIKDHTDLRLELENKINIAVDPIKNKLSSYLTIQWYRWTIIGIVTIVTIWYMFSYKEVHILPRRIDEIERNLENLHKEFESMSRKDSLSLHHYSPKIENSKNNNL